MIQKVKHLLLPCLLLTGSIAFSQSVEKAKQATVQAKPSVKEVSATSQKTSPQVKPASSIANQHGVTIDKKTFVNQNNKIKK